MWIIDFCEDNLLRVEGAEEAAAELQRRLEERFPEAENRPYRIYRQRCIQACRPCHRTSLILRWNNTLIEAEQHEDVIAKVFAMIDG